MHRLEKVIHSRLYRYRLRRGELFRRLLQPTERDRILDLGGGDGSHIATILPHRTNIVVADVLAHDLEKAQSLYGFQTVLLEPDAPLPFADAEFDIVFCSSVIEHVTIPYEEIYTCTSNREFNQRAWANQKRFAAELRRVCRRYFVQTPHRYFFIETHSWLPGIFVLLPRLWQVNIIRCFNRFWIKRTAPDYRLLTTREMRTLFPDAKIWIERVLGWPKSIVAYKTSDTSHTRSETDW